MGLITKEVMVTLNFNNYKHYQKLGYSLPIREASLSLKQKGKNWVLDLGSKFKVNVADLPDNSRIRVDVQCDICGKVVNTSYSSYVKNIKNKKEHLYTCRDCGFQRQKETNLLKYGVENVFQLPEFQEKARTTKKTKKDNDPNYDKKIRDKVIFTSMERYGVSNPMQSQEIKERLFKSNILKYGIPNAGTIPESVKKRNKTIKEKYGVDNISQSDIIKQKKAETYFSHYGVYNGMQSEEVKNKAKKTNREKYGVDCVSQNPIIRNKMSQSLFNNGKVQVSIQQKYLSSLYGGILNYPVFSYNVDIKMEDNLIIEYDGGGHDLNVKMGQITPEEFQQKEIVRSAVIKRAGYKQMHIISHTDKLPSDAVLLDMLEQTKQYFADHPEHSWREWHIDDGIYRDAEHKEGEPYDYGELNTIKKIDAESVA